tara:strand:- start:681 stop:896 length:216 start_codon:yes stop_codon:yes gene_type:complete
MKLISGAVGIDQHRQQAAQRLKAGLGPSSPQDLAILPLGISNNLMAGPAPERRKRDGCYRPFQFDRFAATN